MDSANSGGIATEAKCLRCGKSASSNLQYLGLNRLVCDFCWEEYYRGTKDLPGRTRQELKKEIKKAVESSQRFQPLLRKFGVVKVSELAEKITALENQKTTLEKDVEKYRGQIWVLLDDRARARKSLARACCELFEITELTYVVHWKNVGSILEMGLLCRNRAKSLDVIQVDFAYETALKLRSRKSVLGYQAQDYVPLFFSPKPPMLHALSHKFPQREIVYILVSKEILGEEAVCFTDRNLAATGCSVFDNIEDLSQLQWATIRNPIRARTQTVESNIQGAEVLVPQRVDPGWFQEIIVYDESMKRTLDRTVPKGRSIPINVNREFYF